MKNRLFTFLCLCLSLVLVFALVACEEEASRIPQNNDTHTSSSTHDVSQPVRTLDYYINEDGKTCTVRGVGNITSRDVVIPEEIDGYTVTGIAEYAFEEQNWISSLSIPKTLKTIPYNIGDLYGVTAIYLDDLTAWCNIEGLDNLTRTGKNDKILYVKGKPVIDLVIPNDVTNIGDYAFSKFTGLTSVTIPDSVTSIGVSAFYNCTGLTSVTIGNGVTSIDRHAFSGCTGLTSIIFHGTMEEWKALINEQGWDGSTGTSYTTYCSDGNVTSQNEIKPPLSWEDL